MDYELYYTAFRTIIDRISVMEGRIQQLKDAASKGYAFNPNIITQMDTEVTKQKNRLILLNGYADLPNSEFVKRYLTGFTINYQD